MEAADEVCDSGHYTNSGECCIQCPPGEGVIRECGAKQTECAQCLDSEYRIHKTINMYTHKCPIFTLSHASSLCFSYYEKGYV